MTFVGAQPVTAAMGVDNPRRTPQRHARGRLADVPLDPRAAHGRGLLTVSLPLAAFAVLIGSVLWRFYPQQMGPELATQARVIAEQVAPSSRTPREHRSRA